MDRMKLIIVLSILNCGFVFWLSAALNNRRHEIDKLRIELVEARALVIRLQKELKKGVEPIQHMRIEGMSEAVNE